MSESKKRCAVVRIVKWSDDILRWQAVCQRHDAHAPAWLDWDTAATDAWLHDREQSGGVLDMSDFIEVGPPPGADSP